MRIRGYSPVLWRRPGESQIGAETGHATVLTDLSQQEQRLLDHLPATLEPGSVYHAARRAQVPVPRAREILQDLERRGALVHGARSELGGPDAVYWERLRLGARQRSTVLGSSTIALCGSGALLQETALWLAEAGVGTILSTAPDRADGADQLLAARFPTIRTRAPLGTRPDLVLTVDSHVVEPLQARRLAQEGLLQLSVVVREVSVRVGPVLGSPSGPCATCLGLWERDADPCWPALATQMRTLPPPQTERLLLHQAAALAARAATDSLLAGTVQRSRTPTTPSNVDGAPGPLPSIDWASTSVELSGPDPTGTARHWPRHEECLCSQV
ncbi:hypothetical protein D4740_08305 [Actinomyces sp. 2119]|uniref:hypothetical protein n=1 Tax=Actinomyces sp. 2119 TaxID=2321393 RepID=UPI000E6B7E4B|nr:hypothetical protein [Actinomyces sp. 2119]RJF41393.1 hypothetical protein D4740_08305 [Actinomyces sp. 2119]